MKIPNHLNINEESIEQHVDSDGNTYKIRVLGKGENLFFQENDKYLFCLIDAAHGIIEVDSINKWEPDQKMSPEERNRVIQLIEEYYRKVYHPDVRLYSRRAQRKQEDLMTIINEITQVEVQLSEWKENLDQIDLNDPNWREAGEEQMSAFYLKYGGAIQRITQHIIQFFKKSEINERQVIWKALSKTNNLRNHLHTEPQPEATEDWLNDRLLVLIISDLGVDTRDVLMEIQALQKEADQLNIDFKSIVQQHIHLANTENKHGMGSMRMILETMIDSVG